MAVDSSRACDINLSVASSDERSAGRLDRKIVVKTITVSDTPDGERLAMAVPRSGRDWLAEVLEVLKGSTAWLVIERVADVVTEVEGDNTAGVPESLAYWVGTTADVDAFNDDDGDCKELDLK